MTAPSAAELARLNQAGRCDAIAELINDEGEYAFDRLCRWYPDTPVMHLARLVEQVMACRRRAARQGHDRELEAADELIGSFVQANTPASSCAPSAVVS